MDKYFVYRPLLDLIGFTEGTDKGDGYNETLAYGKMLDGKITKGKGPDVILTRMTLTSIDQLQTKMLADPDNKKLNSSAIGRYQIVRTTLRSMKETLNLPGSALFDEEMQDRLCCYLLGVRGIDKYLAGRLKEDTLINNLAREWASFPTTANKGFYAGQHTPITAARVRETLKEVKRRHQSTQPQELVQVVPKEIPKEVNQKTNWLTSIFGGFFGTGFSLSWFSGMDRDGLILIAGIGIIVTLVVLIGGKWMVQRLKAIAAEINS